MNDAMVPAKGLIRFPKTTGITGKVFATQKPIFFNNANVKSNYLFQADIDNTASINDISNLAFFAITRETGSTIGVVQLYNKMKPIVAQDIKKIQAISRFFGGCIHNLEAITKRLTTTLAVQMQAPETSKYLERTDQLLHDQEVTWNNAAKPVENVKNEVNMGTSRNEDLIKMVLKDIDTERGDYNVIYGRPKMPPRKLPSVRIAD